MTCPNEVSNAIVDTARDEDAGAETAPDRAHLTRPQSRAPAQNHGLSQLEGFILHDPHVLAQLVQHVPIDLECTTNWASVSSFRPRPANSPLR